FSACWASATVEGLGRGAVRLKPVLPVRYTSDPGPGVTAALPGHAVNNRGESSLKANQKVYCAVAAILSAHALAANAATPADTTPAAEESSTGISEVVVTAERRSENIQDVPIAIQALTSETLKQLNVQTFDDYVKYIPSVTFKSNGRDKASSTCAA